MTAHLCLGCADDGGCDVCRPRCGQDAPVLLWAGAVSVASWVVGGCWLVWRAWFA